MEMHTPFNKLRYRNCGIYLLTSGVSYQNRCESPIKIFEPNIWRVFHIIQHKCFFLLYKWVDMSRLQLLLECISINKFFLEKTEKAFTNEQPRATGNIEHKRYRKTTNKATPPPPQKIKQKQTNIQTNKKYATQHRKAKKKMNNTDAGKPLCSGRVNRFCSMCDTRCVTLATNPVISHKLGNER
jgi:hypothetical protein